MVTVRRAQLSGTSAVQRLLQQLGYAADLQLVEQRLRALEHSNSDTALVAELEEAVVGVRHTGTPRMSVGHEAIRSDAELKLAKQLIEQNPSTCTMHFSRPSDL